jgi:hypothetical protein
LPSAYCGPAGRKAKGNESKGTLVGGKKRAAREMRPWLGVEKMYWKN